MESKEDKNFTNLTNWWNLTPSLTGQAPPVVGTFLWNLNQARDLLNLKIGTLQKIFPENFNNENVLGRVIEITGLNPFYFDGLNSSTKNYLNKFKINQLKLLWDHLEIKHKCPSDKKMVINDLMKKIPTYDPSQLNNSSSIQSFELKDIQTSPTNPIRQEYLNEYNLIDHHDIFNNQIFEHQKTSKTWQTVVLYGLITLAISNSFMLWCDVKKLKRKKQGTILDFMQRLAVFLKKN